MNDLEAKRQHLKFSDFFLIYKLNEDYPINVLLEGDDLYLEPNLENLLKKGFVEIDGSYYQLSSVGREIYQNYMKRYIDFLVNFDVFCAVDLSSGEFAFEKFWQIKDEKEWSFYLGQERFEDLRIAVTRHKKIDPQEIVFMSFLNENRFDQITKLTGWQFDVASGAIWKEIDKIVDNAITTKELAYQNENDYIEGEDVLIDVIESGAKLNLSLWEEEADYFRKEYEVQTNSREVNQELNSYLDKDYVNPIWKKNIF